MTTLPLYKELHTNEPLWQATGHMGLWFARFYHAYPSIENIRPKKDMHKKEKEHLIAQELKWLKQFKAKKVGDDNALQAKSLQQMALCCEGLSGDIFFAKTQWHFVTGMGLPHPIENGFAWHPTLGVPYLTGAAVKGIVRAWLEVWDTQEDEENQRQRLLRWFGSDNKNPKKQHFNAQAGSLIFFDALPTTRPLLGIDVMTPHMGKWYAEGQQITALHNDSDKLPADWHDPVPVQFLVVKQASLQFCIAPRNKRCAEEIDMSIVMKALQQALKWLGAGAKTAVGYGHFEEDTQTVDQSKNLKKKQKAVQQQNAAFAKAQANLSPLAYAFHRQTTEENWQQCKEAFWQQGVVEKWLNQLEAEAKPVPELREKLEALMNQHFKNVMNNPDKVTGKKNKPFYKQRVITVAKRLIQLRERENTP